jgi:hypothetical protein
LNESKLESRTGPLLPHLLQLLLFRGMTLPPAEKKGKTMKTREKKRREKRKEEEEEKDEKEAEEVDTEEEEDSNSSCLFAIDSQVFTAVSRKETRQEMDPLRCASAH